MGSVFNVAKKMVKKSGGQMSWDQGIKLALLGKGQAKIDFVELSGIFGNKPAKKKGQTP